MCDNGMEDYSKMSKVKSGMKGKGVKDSKACRLRVNSFFAGIGGFDIGFEHSGFTTTFLCEINPFCIEVLKTHWPNVPMFGDIGKLDASQIPDADVWCGGFPCQDISVARGALERKGLGGVRSGLFYQYANLIEARRPKVVVIENVEGLFNSNKGRDFGVILQRLTRLGYAVSWRLFNSRYFGVPQSRARVYICCWKGSVTHSMRVMFENTRTPKPKNERTDFITESNPAKAFPKVPRVAYCLAATSGRHTGTDWSRTYVSCADGVRRMTPKEYERLQGFPDLWTIPSECDADNDDVDTLRYTALGNAVSVPVVEWVARRIKKELVANDSGIDIGKVSEYVSELQAFANDVDLDSTDFTDEDKEFKWPKSGLAWRGHYVGGNIPPSPAVPVESELFDITERGRVGARYYLSPNACKGILRRVDGQGRKLFSPLRVALEKEAKKIKGA